MKKRIILLVLLFLILLGGGWFWYQQKPEQKINGAVDLFLEHVEHRKISTRQPDDVKNAFNEALADKVKLQLQSPLFEYSFLRSYISMLSGEKTREDLIGLAKTIHTMTAFCEITEIERTIKVIGSEAQVYLTANVRAAMGKDGGTQTWELVFDLEKNETWQITGIRGTGGALEEN